MPIKRHVYGYTKRGVNHPTESSDMNGNHFLVKEKWLLKPQGTSDLLSVLKMAKTCLADMKPFSTSRSFRLSKGSMYFFSFSYKATTPHIDFTHKRRRPDRKQMGWNGDTLYGRPFSGALRLQSGHGVNCTSFLVFKQQTRELRIERKRMALIFLLTIFPFHEKFQRNVLLIGWTGTGCLPQHAR